MRTHVIIGIILLALTASSGSIQLSSIKGRVVDAQGKPVEKARLHVDLVGGNPTGRVLFYWSGKDGKFSIDGLKPGTYDIFVSKEEEGYADTQWFLYSGTESQPTRVVVTDQPASDITVPLGPKAGRIRGVVRDSITGAPIADASITFRRPENEKMFLQTSLNKPDSPGSFDFLLPAAPVTMKVTAPGHEDWTFRDFLKLAPGQTLHLAIKMRPSKK